MSSATFRANDLASLNAMQFIRTIEIAALPPQMEKMMNRNLMETRKDILKLFCQLLSQKETARRNPSNHNHQKTCFE